MRVQLPLCAQYAPLAQLAEHLTFNLGGMGSSPIRRTLYAVGSSIGRAPGCGPGGWRFKSVPSAHGTLAQLVEQQIENLRVPGSIPGGSTKIDQSPQKETGLFHLLFEIYQLTFHRHNPYGLNFRIFSIFAQCSEALYFQRSEQGGYRFLPKHRGNFFPPE